MGLPPFTLILISIAGITFIVFVLYVFFSKRSPASSLGKDEENDELIFDSETGKYLTVEELVEEHGLDYLDEQKCQQVYNSLPEDMKQTITFKDVETIMEFHYQIKTSISDENEKIEDEAKYDFLADIFEKKGKTIDKEVFAKVIEIAEKK